MVSLREELGDVLLQVVFHARVEEEAGGFSIADVVDGLCRKLIIRHAHVFGDVRAANAADALTRWDRIKRETKGQETLYAALTAVARSLPALMRADKLLQKVSKAGRDPFGGADAWDKLARDAARLRSRPAEDVDTKDVGSEGGLPSAPVDLPARSADPEKAMGDFLFAAVAAARQLGVDPERALERACDDFAASVGRAEGVLPSA
jgi:uncharacterized protein YabN with tetrapyrrole methylase and pyrophosphatase domain